MRAAPAGHVRAGPASPLACSDSVCHLAYARGTGRVGRERRRFEACALAHACQELEERLRRTALRSPAELVTGPRRVHERDAEREVDPPGRGGLEAEVPRKSGRGPQGSSGDGYRPGVEKLTERLAVEDGIGGEVEGAPDVTREGESERVADVERMHALEAEPVMTRDEGDEARLQERGGEERPREEPADSRGRAAFEDEGWAQPDHTGGWVLALEEVEQPLDLGLVPAVKARRDAVARPALVDLPILGADGIRAHRGGVNERRDAGLGHRAKEALAAPDVRPAQRGRIA